MKKHKKLTAFILAVMLIAVSIIPLIPEITISAASPIWETLDSDGIYYDPYGAGGTGSLVIISRDWDKGQNTIYYKTEGFLFTDCNKDKSIRTCPTHGSHSFLYKLNEQEYSSKQEEIGYDSNGKKYKKVTYEIPINNIYQAMDEYGYHDWVDEIMANTSGLYMVADAIVKIHNPTDKSYVDSDGFSGRLNYIVNSSYEQTHMCEPVGNLYGPNNRYVAGVKTVEDFKNAEYWSANTKKAIYSHYDKLIYLTPPIDDDIPEDKKDVDPVEIVDWGANAKLHLIGKETPDFVTYNYPVKDQFDIGEVRQQDTYTWEGLDSNNRRVGTYEAATKEEAEAYFKSAYPATFARVADIKPGIPTSEYIVNGYRADRWYGYADVAASPQVALTFTFTGRISYIQKGEPSGFWDDLDEDGIKDDWIDTTPEWIETKDYSYTEVVNVNYWYIANADFYDLDYVVTSNEVFPEDNGKRQHTYKSYIETDVECTMNGKSLVTDISEDELPDNSYHIKKPTYNSFIDTGTKSSQSEAADAFNAIAAERMATIKKNIFVRNDKLTVNGKTYMSDEWYHYTEFKTTVDSENTSESAMRSYKEVVASPYKYDPSELSDYKIDTEEAEGQIPFNTANDAYYTSIKAVYKGLLLCSDSQRPWEKNPAEDGISQSYETKEIQRIWNKDNPIPVGVDDPTEEEEQEIVSGGMEYVNDSSLGYRYWIYRPDNPTGKKLPIIFYLHGMGERGSATALGNVPLLKALRTHSESVNAIFVAPLLESGNWNTPDKLKSFFDAIVAKENANPSAITLTSVSLGTNGGWEFVSHYPDYLAGFAPGCGLMSAYSNDIINNPTKFINLPLYIVHDGAYNENSTNETNFRVALVNAGGSIMIRTDTEKYSHSKIAEHMYSTTEAHTSGYGYIGNGQGTINIGVLEWLAKQSKTGEVEEEPVEKPETPVEETTASGKYLCNEPIYIHTPTVAAVTIDNAANDTQLVKDAYNDAADYQFLLDDTYTIQFDPLAHLEHLGYTDTYEDYVNNPDMVEDLYNKYCAYKQVAFTFTAQVDGDIFTPDDSTIDHNGDKKLAGCTEWIDLQDFVSDPFYIPSWAEESAEHQIFIRVAPENIVDQNGEEHWDDEEFLKNITFEGEPLYNYVSTYKLDVQVSGRIYDFQVDGINDKDSFYGLQEDGSSWGFGDVAQNFAFCPEKEEKRAGTRNRLGGSVVRYTLDGSLEYNWSIANTLPFSTGKNNNKTQSGTLKLGNTLAFSVRTMANLWDEEGDYLIIKPNFRYISLDGKENDDIDVYYQTTSNDGKETLMFVPYGSDLDLSLMQQVCIYDTRFDGAYYTDDWLDRTISQDDVAYSMDKTNAYMKTATGIKNYYKNTNQYLHRLSDCFSLSRIVMDNNLRLLTGNYEQLAMNLENEPGEVEYYDDKTNDGASYKLQENVDPEELYDQFRMSMQTWYGAYYIPSQLYVTDGKFEADTDWDGIKETYDSVWDYTVANGSIDGTEDFFKQDGYLVINFDIYTCNNGNPHLVYESSNKDQWSIEGQGGTVKVGDPELDREITVPVRPGDVAIVDLTRNMKEKYYIGINRIN